MLVEYVKRSPGHRNSKGEPAPWTIVSHKTGKIISSHKTKKEAEEHLKRMHVFKEGRIMRRELTESHETGRCENCGEMTYSDYPGRWTKDKRGNEKYICQDCYDQLTPKKGRYSYVNVFTYVDGKYVHGKIGRQPYTDWFEVEVKDCPFKSKSRVAKFAVEKFKKEHSWAEGGKPVAVEFGTDDFFRLRESFEKRGRMLNEAHDWDEFSKDFPNSDKYLPPKGDGDSMGTQASTALCKLVYKWFNDGDVYDNTHGMEGWANDISGCANWLWTNIPETREVLNQIEDIGNDEDAYTDILYDLCAIVDPMIPDLLNKEKKGDAYNGWGPFEFIEWQTCERCGEKFDPDSREWDRMYGMCKDCAEETEREEEEEEEERRRREKEEEEEEEEEE